MVHILHLSIFAVSPFRLDPCQLESDFDWMFPPELPIDHHAPVGPLELEAKLQRTKIYRGGVVWCGVVCVVCGVVCGATSSDAN